MKKPYKQPGVIYVLRAEQLPGVYKVGFTTRSPQRRAEQIAQSQPYTLDVVGSIRVPNMYAEKRLHTVLEGARVDGEWYRLTDEQVAQILNDQWLKSCGVVRVEDKRRDYARFLSRKEEAYAQKMCVLLAAAEAIDATSSRLRVERIAQLERTHGWATGAVKATVYAARDEGEIGKISGGRKEDLYRFDILGVAP